MKTLKNILAFAQIQGFGKNAGAGKSGERPLPPSTNSWSRVIGVVTAREAAAAAAAAGDIVENGSGRYDDVESDDMKRSAVASALVCRET